MSAEPKIGEYIYMGMAKCAGHRVCISVAYKLDYCVKKALQFEKASNQLVWLDKVNKVKVGQLEAETSFTRSELVEYISRFTNNGSN